MEWSGKESEEKKKLAEDGYFEEAAVIVLKVK